MPGVIYTHKIHTPIGEMIAGATDAGLCLLEFADRPALQREIADLQQYLDAELANGAHEYNKMAEQQMNEYFAGDRKEFEIPLVSPGTEFQRRIWAGLLQIPYGQTRTYAEQAKLLAKPGAIRAVGRANGGNRIAIIIPCHRVIGADGSLTGYGGGLWRKKFLLGLEAKYSNNYSLFS